MELEPRKQKLEYYFDFSKEKEFSYDDIEHLLEVTKEELSLYMEQSNEA